MLTICCILFYIYIYVKIIILVCITNSTGGQSCAKLLHNWKRSWEHFEKKCKKFCCQNAKINLAFSEKVPMIFASVMNIAQVQSSLNIWK